MCIELHDKSVCLNICARLIRTRACPEAVQVWHDSRRSECALFCSYPNQFLRGPLQQDNVHGPWLIRLHVHYTKTRPTLQSNIGLHLENNFLPERSFYFKESNFSIKNIVSISVLLYFFIYIKP